MSYSHRMCQQLIAHAPLSARLQFWFFVARCSAGLSPRAAARGATSKKARSSRWDTSCSVLNFSVKSARHDLQYVLHLRQSCYLVRIIWWTRQVKATGQCELCVEETGNQARRGSAIISPHFAPFHTECASPISTKDKCRRIGHDFTNSS